MFYIYNKQTLQFEKVNWVSYGLKILGGLILLSFIFGLGFKPNIKEKYSEEEVMIINSKFNKFDSEKLINKIKELNFRFPHIVYAQSILETGYFKKGIFTENHNLFSMKRAFKRINTAKGEENGHAYYDDWTESVIDYALYSATYLYSLKTEAEYLNYLGQNYAEDKEYVAKLKNIIKKDHILNIFN